ncbi:Hypothetical protein IALB_1118 [Ignavibacterium album JCM 16511]|uniref:Uncharacterized protein n=1 Tax=Ignavibacterium album (strain DSM 19864 / JCM 16511 / NBRC 101810 / Mat9-16) TaxID=945713 RepID=I0AIM2_IGNAJ|nr:hypothetical protein [Ignavibacterium album]AFH48829.1 Hypothetical protein IALB_1118 [Ignavibacterium album JCM 16511]
MKRINKILSLKRSFLLIAIYILFFLFLNAGKELLHNHKPDIYEHDDCPVLILSQILSSGILYHFELQNDFIVESSLKSPQIFVLLQSNYRTVSLRGPPII